jgi:hypothetical protein
MRGVQLTCSLLLFLCMPGTRRCGGTFRHRAHHLRGNSAYAAWADAEGDLIKLVPLPFNAKAANWIVRERYEKSVAELRPADRLCANRTRRSACFLLVRDATNE